MIVKFPRYRARKKRAPKGWKWVTIQPDDAGPMELLTADLNTPAGRKLLKKAYEMIGDCDMVTRPCQ